MSDLRQCTRDFLCEFLNIYREHECLWKVKSGEYLDKEKKIKAYEILKKKLLEVDSKATIESTKKKINSLRTNFRAELKKVLASQWSGAGEEEIYKPSLWYYDQLLFLTDQEIPRPTLSSRENILESEENTLVPNHRNAQKRIKSSSVAEAEGFLKQAQIALTNKEDSFDIYGKHLACELRSLDSQETVYVQKLFNDILFEAKTDSIRNIEIKKKSIVSHTSHSTTESSNSVHQSSDVQDFFRDFDFDQEN